MNLEEARQTLAELGRKNLWFLTKGVVFPEPLDASKFRYNKELHRELAWAVSNPAHSKKLIMIPRGFLKSTIGTKARAIQWAIRDPNERILISSGTSTNAERFLRHIKAIFEQNSLFRWLYPEVIPDFTKVPWSTREATVRRSSSFPEPTFDTAGVGTALPSRHYTKIIKDDPVNDKNSNTQELIDQVIEWDASTIPLFDSPEDPSNEELVIGTPWSPFDMYSLKRKDRDYAVYVRHALEGVDGKPDFSNGVPIYPERYPKERIHRIRQRLENDDLFFCQYMCDPHGGQGAQFRREYLQYYENPPSVLEVSITIDPGGLRDGSDFTAFAVVGVDEKNDWYVLWTSKVRFNPREIIDEMFRLCDMFHPHTIGVETVAWQKSLQFFAIEEMKRRGKFLPLRELRTDTRVSKEMRIRGLIPRFSNRTVWLKKGMTDLEDEMFRRVRNDDLIDALAYQLQVAVFKPQVVEEILRNPFSMESILEELARKNQGAAHLLELGLKDTLSDTQPRWQQLKEGNA